MPSIRIKPVTGEIYHIYNRGNEKRDIFRDKLDYIRFIHNLFEFNDTAPAPDFLRRYKPVSNVRGPTPHIMQPEPRPRDFVVEILAFCLMKNHYHLLVRQIKNNGIPLFMKKLSGGYTCGFNIKHERVGSLFQGKYKLKHIDKEDYLRNIICYIHLNPLKFLRCLKKDGKMDILKTVEALTSFHWSSHLDYLGEDNWGSVINKKFIIDLFGDASGYKDFVRDWLYYESERLEEIMSVAIDVE